ncbi:type IVB secretion system protein IcmH/DotU [Endozoicomonas sp.]|uniref:type IVB secretion system protein IcmH/DotU n=1 Tax=Endozoicomonas sp. TaxID=1892382 RepID=UPI0028884588|nr:type IVB secretion system protein IcmH/DotU [Endozoicomonas sp.]
MTPSSSGNEAASADSREKGEEALRDNFRDESTLFRNFNISSNTLINLSAELLAILTTLSQQQEPGNLPELHQYLLRSISELHNQGLNAGYPPRMMEKTCYALCAAFDEEVMNTAWGQAGCWENHSLVAQLFQQRNAGEVFFVLLEQARQNAPKMIDFIELLYLLLRLGFCGRYQNTDKHELAKLADNLYQEIREHQKPGEQQALPILSAPWRPLKVIRVRYYLPVVVLILGLSGIASHFWIQHINRTYTGLSDLQREQVQATPVQLSTSLIHSLANPGSTSKPHKKP